MRNITSYRRLKSFNAIINYKTNGLLKTILVMTAALETPNEQDIIENIRELSGDIDIEIVNFYILS